MTYQILSAPASAKLVVKKSEFLGYAYPIASRDELALYSDRLSQQYPDARHICYGYIIGDPNNTTSAGFFDDGEPSGTAGKPILSVLQHKAIGDCALFVVRYFGGIKLGAGGLVRAYAKTAQMTVDEMALQPFVAQGRYRLVTDFANEAFVRHCLAQLGGVVVDSHYSSNHDSGNNGRHNGVQITIQMDLACVDKLRDRLGHLILIEQG